jgi:hypothetical protein
MTMVFFFFPKLHIVFLRLFWKIKYEFCQCKIGSKVQFQSVTYELDLKVKMEFLRVWKGLRKLEEQNSSQLNTTCVVNSELYYSINFYEFNKFI